MKPPWKENDAEKRPFRPGNAAADAFKCNGPLAGPTSTGGSEAASVSTMKGLVLLMLPWLLLAQIASFSTKHATLDPAWEQPVADRKRPRLRRKRANDPAATTCRERLGHSNEWCGMTAGSIMVFHGIRDCARRLASVMCACCGRATPGTRARSWQRDEQGRLRPARAVFAVLRRRGRTEPRRLRRWLVLDVAGAAAHRQFQDDLAQALVDGRVARCRRVHDEMQRWALLFVPRRCPIGAC